MRPGWIIGSALCTSLVCVLSIRAEPTAGEATITQHVEVRSGPSAKFYPTSVLEPGAKVIVVTEKEVPWLTGWKKPQPGWVAIRPPEKSFGWVNEFALQFTGPGRAQIASDAPADIHVGSAVYGGEPNVVQMRLEKGIVATLLDGPKHTDASGTWVMIAPLAQEVRYVPEAALAKTTTAANLTGTAKPQAAGDGKTQAVVDTQAQKSAVDPLFQQAEKAEKEGRRDDAIRLYRQLAGQTTNHALSIQCWNRIHYIEQGMAASVAPTPMPGYPAESLFARQPANAAIPAPGSPNPPVSFTPIRPASQYTYTPEIAVPAPVTRAPANYTPQPAMAPQVRTGWLCGKSPDTAYGRSAYCLYLGPNAGVVRVVSDTINLDAYVNHKISVTGPIVYHPNHRSEVLTAINIAPAP